ncbi:Heat shock 70 kDa protein 14 [Xenoophorus captivus]|uniref:Heat shock 70 kDa protein 14 n=1 Tax=Xenoophorus captivus TaxID=1517983 RepID=A0ABV0SCY7_9TELE
MPYYQITCGEHSEFVAPEDVVLCGGSSRIPRLQQMIREMFPDVELLNSSPPDEVIAVGAAIEAGLLVGRDGLAPEEESVAVDVSAADILLKVTWSI